jgi:hypothetical protein
VDRFSDRYSESGFVSILEANEHSWSLTFFVSTPHLPSSLPMEKHEHDVFFDSDLSELTDDEDDDEATPPQGTLSGSATASSSKTERLASSRATAAGQKTYVVRDVLRAPRPAQYSVKSLHGALYISWICSVLPNVIRYRATRRRHHQLEPRLPAWCVLLASLLALSHLLPSDVVWPEAKQIGLIDSVFRNYYIPPVIFGMSLLQEV